MSRTSSQLRIDKTSPLRWNVTFDHPPMNLIDPDTVRELLALVGDMEADPEVRVVVFDSADPGGAADGRLPRRSQRGEHTRRGVVIGDVAHGRQRPAPRHSKRAHG